MVNLQWSSVPSRQRPFAVDALESNLAWSFRWPQSHGEQRFTGHPPQRSEEMSPAVSIPGVGSLTPGRVLGIEADDALGRPANMAIPPKHSQNNKRRYDRRPPRRLSISLLLKKANDRCECHYGCDVTAALACSQPPILLLGMKILICDCRSSAL